MEKRFGSIGPVAPGLVMSKFLPLPSPGSHQDDLGEAVGPISKGVCLTPVDKHMRSPIMTKCLIERLMYLSPSFKNLH